MKKSSLNNQKALWIHNICISYKKALYGLKQDPRAWYDSLMEFLLKLDMREKERLRLFIKKCKVLGLVCPTSLGSCGFVDKYILFIE